MIILYFEFLNILYQRYEYKTTAEIVKFSLCKNKEKKKDTMAEYTTSNGRKVMIKQTMCYENATQINRIKWHYYIDGVFHSIQNLDMRMFFPKELDFYLKSSGFNIVHKFGSFEEDDFCNDSEKQIYVLSKKIV